MKKLLKKIILIAANFLFVILFCFNSTSAQNEVGTSQKEGGFEIFSNTNNFSSGYVVNFSLKSFKIDLDKSDITWTIGNKNILSGFGEKEAEITIPDKEAELKVKITTTQGETYFNSFRLYNKSIALYWEATDSRVPFWYEGKKMLVKGGTAKVYAFSNITNNEVKISDENLFYSWEINGVIQKNKSGFGKNYLDIYVSDTTQNNLEIKVTATPKLSTETVSATENIKITETKTLLYLKSENNNIKKSVSGSQNFKTRDFILQAEPFFFSLDNNYKYFWTVSGKETVGDYEKGFKVSKEGIKTVIKVKIEHARKLFQEAESELVASF